MLQKKNVLLLETVSAQADQLLNDHLHVKVALDYQKAIAAVETSPIHAIITRGKGQVDRKLIQACHPALAVIARCGVGLDNIDIQTASKLIIPVMNAPGSNADTVAEHTLALMLSLQRRLYHSIHAVKTNHWDSRNHYGGDEIRGKTLGILGLGNIGLRVAKLAKAFGMKILYWKRTPASDDYKSVTFEQLLRQSDILSLHLPLTAQTRHIINHNALQKVKSTALIINTARGGLLETAALFQSLTNGQLAGYAADCLEKEPPVDNDPLLQLENVLVTPHSASLTATTYNQMCVDTVQRVVDLLNGSIVDPFYIFNRNSINFQS